MLNEDEEAATERLHAAILAEAAAFGAHELDEAGNRIPDKQIDATLSEWILVMSWTTGDHGRALLTRATSSGLPIHHENGLLHEALYNFD